MFFSQYDSKHTFSRVAISLDGGWSILKIFRPRLMSASCFFKASIWARMFSMLPSASVVTMLLVNGPFCVNSSTRLWTCFLNSSDWPRRFVLNFSWNYSQTCLALYHRKLCFNNCHSNKVLKTLCRIEKMLATSIYSPSLTTRFSVLSKTSLKNCETFNM